MLENARSPCRQQVRPRKDLLEPGTWTPHSAIEGVLPTRRGNGQFRGADQKDPRLTAALARAATHDGPCMIEVAIDHQDCSLDMREWGTRVAAANGMPPRS